MAEISKFERPQIAKEFPLLRENYKKLLALNPNAFASLQPSKAQPLSSLKGNTTYERLGCIGFQPEQNMLKAVVYINQTSGYGSGLCGGGSTEYVRFFLSYDNGATWEDQGLTSFQAYNVNHPTRLEAAVEKQIDPRKLICRRENLIRVRAILSWEVPPPADPNWPPVWGNRTEATIQIAPKRLSPITEILKVDPEILPLLDLDKPLSLKTVDPPVETIAKSYVAAKVPIGRALHPLLMQAQASPKALTALKVSPALATMASIYAIDLNTISQELLKVGDGNQDYEQLTCIGLQPGMFVDQLVGVINVRKSAGYSGGVCTKGSREYIAYYMDFGTGWQYMGTASVRVHDITSLPADGLKYTAFLPVDLRAYRQRCQTPVLAKMRAILSWETPPPVDPEWVPTWGGREDTTVLLTPTRGNLDTQALTPFITAAAGVSTEKINPLTGLATAATPFVVNQAPFGGEVQISGYILNHPNYSAGGGKLRYKVMVSSDGVNFAPMANDFPISVDQWLGSVPTQFDLTQSVDGDGFYSYQVDQMGPDLTFVDGDVLFRFYTGGLNGPRWIRIDVEHPQTLTIIKSNTLKLMIDNTPPTLVFSMDQSPCADISVGAKISGTYNATDLHMGDVILAVYPSGSISKTGLVIPLTPLTQQSGTWEVETSGLGKCGYVVQAYAVDRAIVNNAPFGNSSQLQSFGFCLR